MSDRLATAARLYAELSAARGRQAQALTQAVRLREEGASGDDVRIALEECDRQRARIHDIEREIRAGAA